MINKIEEVIKNVFEEMGYDKELVKVNVSSRPELCEFQVNSVFSLAKSLGKNPIEIGEGLVEKINLLDDFSLYFDEVSFAKPGFINIKVSNKLILDELNSIINSGNFGINKIDYSSTCVVDYGGPNIAKPLHVGHIRPAIIGQSIYEILKAKGYKTIGDVHLGDIGLQMGQVIYGLLERNLKPSDITIELLQEIYPLVSGLCKENDSIKAKCQEITKKLQDGDSFYNSYFEVMHKVSLDDIKRLYDYFGVSFDYWYGEKDSYKYMDKLMSYLDKSGVIEEDDGAKIVRVSLDSDKKEMPPVIIKGSNGAYLYASSDLATIYQRMEDFDPNHIIYVVDARQRLHFEQIFRVCKKSGLSRDAVLEHTYFGTINGMDGKPFKTRSGETLKLDDLITMVKEIFISKKESNSLMKKSDIDKIVNAIIKFADLQNNRERDYIFDIDKFSDVNGKTGPYILYTAVRIRKLFENNDFSDVLADTIYNSSDKELRMKLLEVSSVVDKACLERMPHYIADYLYDLAVLVNNFYQNNNISKLSDVKNKNEWISLLKYTYLVIEKLLSLLVIEIPSEM